MAFCNSIDEVREFFSKDLFATENGAVVEEYGKNYSKCSLRIESKHKNAMGALMGGVSFTLADFAFAVASNWEQPGTVSLDSTIHFSGPAKGDMLFAEATCMKDGKTTCLYLIEVFDNLEQKVATIMTTGYKVKK